MGRDIAGVRLAAALAPRAAAPDARPGGQGARRANSPPSTPLCRASGRPSWRWATARRTSASRRGTARDQEATEAERAAAAEEARAAGPGGGSGRRGLLPGGVGARPHPGQRRPRARPTASAARRPGRAVRVLDQVPTTSRNYDAARIAALRILTGRGSRAPPRRGPPFRRRRDGSLNGPATTRGTGSSPRSGRTCWRATRPPAAAPPGAARLALARGRRAAGGTATVDAEPDFARLPPGDLFDGAGSRRALASCSTARCAPSSAGAGGPARRTARPRLRRTPGKPVLTRNTPRSNGNSSSSVRSHDHSGHHDRPRGQPAEVPPRGRGREGPARHRDRRGQRRGRRGARSRARRGPGGRLLQLDGHREEKFRAAKNAADRRAAAAPRRHSLRRRRRHPRSPSPPTRRTAPPAGRHDGDADATTRAGAEARYAACSRPAAPAWAAGCTWPASCWPGSPRRSGMC